MAWGDGVVVVVVIIIRVEFRKDKFAAHFNIMVFSNSGKNTHRNRVSHLILDWNEPGPPTFNADMLHVK